LATVLLVGCGGASDEPSTVPVPKGFDVPSGTELTKGGTSLTAGHSASVVYQVADKTRSVIQVTVSSVAKGDIGDFRFFSLDEASKASTPFYVKATVKNLGPAGLGGAPLPLYAHDSDNSIAPPNQLIGEFEPCPHGSLPKSFLPGATAQVCLVYLVPKGTTLVSIDLQTSDQRDAITWQP
jgi:hypothetical protein